MPELEFEVRLLKRQKLLFGKYFISSAVSRCYIFLMNIVELGPEGKLSLPKEIRDRFDLKEGDKLDIDFHGDTIELRRLSGESRFKEIDGVWVFMGGVGKLEDRDYVAEERQARISHLINLGFGDQLDAEK